MSTFEIWQDGENIGGIGGPDTSKYDALALGKGMSKYGWIKVKDSKGVVIGEFDPRQEYQISYDY